MLFGFILWCALFNVGWEAASVNTVLPTTALGVIGFVVCYACLGALYPFLISAFLLVHIVDCLLNGREAARQHMRASEKAMLKSTCGKPIDPPLSYLFRILL
jgi:hypothetical protein